MLSYFFRRDIILTYNNSFGCFFRGGKTGGPSLRSARACGNKGTFSGGRGRKNPDGNEGKRKIYKYYVYAGKSIGRGRARPGEGRFPASFRSPYPVPVGGRRSEKRLSKKKSRVPSGVSGKDFIKFPLNFIKSGFICLKFFGKCDTIENGKSLFCAANGGARFFVRRKSPFRGPSGGGSSLRGGA